MLNDKELRFLHSELLRLGKRVVSLREVYEPCSRYAIAFAADARTAMRQLVRAGMARPMPAGTRTSRGKAGREVWELIGEGA